MSIATIPIPSREPAVRRLGAFIASAPNDHAPLALDRARTAFLDTVGCMLLGEGPKPLVQYVPRRPAGAAGRR